MGDLQTSQSGGVTFFSFAPWRLGIFETSLGPGRVMPHEPSEVLPATGAVAALNGPQYDLCPGQTSDATSTCDIIDFLQLDTSRGVSDPSTRPGDGITISVVNGAAQVMPGGVITPGASAAVQLWPALVSGGSNVVNASAGTNPNVVWRSALCIMSDGNLAFAAGIGAMSDFADALIAGGAVTAGYTDGGGSSQLVTQGGSVGAAEQRRVASWLIATGGNPPWMYWLGAAAIAGVVYFLGMPWPWEKGYREQFRRDRSRPDRSRRP